MSTVDPTAVSIRRTGRTREVRSEPRGNARKALLPLEPGMEVYCLTHGQFSLVDAIAVLLTETGPATVDICTWTAATGDLKQAERFLANGNITDLRFVVDRSFPTRKPDYCAALVEAFGRESMATCRVHAKFATIRNAEWQLAVRTSMNLNPNPRLEAIEVSDDPALAAFLVSQVDSIFAGSVSIGGERSNRRGKRTRTGLDPIPLGVR